jgi:radical SAM superfamily enzyme YgiQ (UPF0313 family)
VRTKTTSQIIDELESIYAHKWQGDVFFVDDNFIGKRQQLKTDLLPAIINWMDKRKHPFLQYTGSLDGGDELMTMAGRFRSVFIGIESPSDSSLSECNKTQNAGRDIVAAVKKIQRFGMQVQAGFIVGFDSDKPGVFDRMIRLIQDSGVVTAMVGLLNAPRGTKLYKKLMSENRLSKLPTGDNMDYTMNFIPKMDIHELLGGYQKVLNTIYSQKYYCKRIKVFLGNYNFRNNKRIKLRYHDIMALLKSMWRIGMIEKGRMHYWMLLIWSLRKPRCLPIAVRLAICGYHFRKMLKTINPQVNERISSSNKFINVDHG